MKPLDVFYYRLKPNDTLDSVAQNFVIKKDNIIRNNPNIPIYSGEVVKIERPNYVSHFVGPAETIESIAQMYNTSYEELKSANNLISEKLYIGQEIKIFNKNN